MKAVILAGGFGSRISEESHLKPKPLIEIGGKPILWHIMKTYSSHGIHDFIICCGYKGYRSKNTFRIIFFICLTWISICETMKWKFIKKNRNHGEWRDRHRRKYANWGRIKTNQRTSGWYLCLTYGDGLSDIDIEQLIAFIRNKKTSHRYRNSTSRPVPLKYQNEGSKFFWKPKGDNRWVNGGFFVCEPEILNYIQGDDTWETEPLENLGSSRTICFRNGFGVRWIP